MELTRIKGIGPKTEKLFNKLGVFTCEDLVRYYPVHYDAYMPPCPAGNVIVGAKCAVQGTIAKAVVVRPTGRVTISTTEIDDPRCAGDDCKGRRCTADRACHNLNN